MGFICIWNLNIVVNFKSIVKYIYISKNEMYILSLRMHVMLPSHASYKNIDEGNYTQNRKLIVWG